MNNGAVSGYSTTRRAFLALVVAALLIGSCSQGGIGDGPVTSARPSQANTGSGRDGRLTARPGAPATDAPTGTITIETGGRQALLFVPKSYRPQTAAPLAVMLHGAGGAARGGLDLLQELAEANGMLLLAPASGDRTWDVIVDDFGPDVLAIDRALDEVFAAYAVDARRLAIGGFSDGASYALSLGLANGDLFSHVIAFSPGFMSPPARVGRPAIYVSHGVRDDVLPIDACSRRIVPRLEREGYDVLYREFDGPHTVPDDIRAEAVEWLNESAAAGSRQR